MLIGHTHQEREGIRNAHKRQRRQIPSPEGRAQLLPRQEDGAYHLSSARGKGGTPARSPAPTRIHICWVTKSQAHIQFRTVKLWEKQRQMVPGEKHLNPGFPQRGRRTGLRQSSPARPGRAALNEPAAPTGSRAGRKDRGDQTDTATKSQAHQVRLKK